MTTIYRVKCPFSGEIRETSNFKRLFGIALSILRDYVDKAGHGAFFKAERLILERVTYDCSDETDDYWNYTELDSEDVAMIYVSSYSIAFYRVSDAKLLSNDRV